MNQDFCFTCNPGSTPSNRAIENLCLIPQPVNMMSGEGRHNERPGLPATRPPENSIDEPPENSATAEIRQEWADMKKCFLDFLRSRNSGTSQPLYPYMAQMSQVDQILEPPGSTARHTGTPAAQMQAAYSSAAQPPTSARGAEEASSTLTISTVVQRPASLKEEEQRL